MQPQHPPCKRWARAWWGPIDLSSKPYAQPPGDDVCISILLMANPTLLTLTVSSIHQVVECVLVTCECELAVVRWALLQALDSYCAEVAWNQRAALIRESEELGAVPWKAAYETCRQLCGMPVVPGATGDLHRHAAASAGPLTCKACVIGQHCCGPRHKGINERHAPLN